MISFEVFSKDNKNEVAERLSARVCDEAAISAISEIIDGMLDGLCEDMELAAAVSSGCMLLRVFDMGRYAFPFPYEICEDADISAAVLEICEYAMREEIPRVFTDVPPECLGAFCGFRHLNLDAEDGEELSYRVTVKTECELLSEIPEVNDGRLSLTAIRDEDVSSYARLAKDEDSLKFWGYDYREDVGADVSDGYFMETAASELAMGVSLSAAVRYDGVFVGEAIIYAFDGLGGAEFAVRILPEERGRGLGRMAVNGAISLARKIGLKTLRAFIMEENAVSIKMVEGVMHPVDTCDGRVLFTVDI